MTIIRVGTTKKYSDGWMSAFGGKKKTASNGTASKKTAAKGAKTAKISAKKSKAAPKKKATR